MSASPGPPRRSRPKPDRLPPDHPRYAEIMAAHDTAAAAGQVGYLDPDSGLFVLTAAFLADRGTCCGRGCRHCPYPPGAAEPGVAQSDVVEPDAAEPGVAQPGAPPEVS